MRSKLPQSCPDSFGIRREIERTKRADLAIASQPRIGLDTDDRTVEDGYGFPAGPFVASLVQRELDAMCDYASDFHGFPEVPPVPSPAQSGRCATPKISLRDPPVRAPAALSS